MRPAWAWLLIVLTFDVALASPSLLYPSARSADGTLVSYDAKGSGNPALVFIHCWTCNRSVWNKQFDYFSKRYRVVRLDLAGHGESAAVRKTYSIAAFADDVIAVVDTLNLQSMILVGHSLGGPVALEVEKRLGDRVLGIVGVDAFYTGFPYPTGNKISALLQPLLKEFPAYRELIGPQVFSYANRPQLQQLLSYLVGNNNKAHLSALTELILWSEQESESALQRAAPKLKNINADTQGLNKPSHPSVIVIPNTGHFVARENPAAFNQALEDIVKTFVQASTQPRPLSF